MDIVNDLNLIIKLTLINELNLFLLIFFILINF